MTAGPGHFALLSSLVFGLGLFGVLTRRDAAGLLMSMLVLFTAPVIALVGFAHEGGGSAVPPTGDALAVFAVVAAATEAVAGIALLLLLWRRIGSGDASEFDDIAAPSDAEA
ncbi:MAG: NADH-quinone oxidoreductase subunit K [Candidatus Dormibacteraeota bacterium]|nr:NADH-quinone oxidoreductase subunit K [Candidatus Dormibacteraeota bacterium]MBV9525328.1 NADH-quinone oxidoreductase subunit K [Candidatus Dormibacteraeota bacterium]